MSEKKEKKVEQKKPKTKFQKFLIGSACLAVVAVIVGPWYAKGTALETELTKVLDHNGEVVQTVEYMGHQFAVNEGEMVARSNLISIKKTGFPFNPGVIIDVDIELITTDPRNAASMKLPLRGLIIETDAYSLDGARFTLPTEIHSTGVAPDGTIGAVDILNKGLVISVSQANGISVDGLSFSAVSKQGGESRSISADRVIFQMNRSLTFFDAMLRLDKMAVGFAIEGSGSNSIALDMVAYKGTVENMLNTESEEVKALAARISKPGGDNEAYREVLRLMAANGAKGELNIKVAKDSMSYIKIEGYAEPTADATDMSGQVIVKGSNINDLMTLVTQAGFDRQALNMAVGLIRSFAHKSGNDDVELLEIELQYKDHVVSMNQKPVMSLKDVDSMGYEIPKMSMSGPAGGPQLGLPTPEVIVPNQNQDHHKKH